MHQQLRRRSAGMLWLTLATLPALRADVTLRYQNKVDLNPNLPAQLTQQMTKSMSVSLPPSQTMQFRNGKLLTALGTFNSIADFNKREITIVDPTGKRYATIPTDQFSDAIMQAMPAMSDQAKASMAAMKSHSESKNTGRTETIQGVVGEEREIDLTVDAPPMPNVPPGPMLRMVIHLWTAKAGEAARVPALGEIAKYDFTSAGVDPLSMMSKAFQQMPGLGDSIAAMMKEMRAGGAPTLLRMRMELYMPMVTALLKQSGAVNSTGDAGAEQPLARITEELSEISTAPVADSVFQMPEGYQSAPAADILKAMMKQNTPAMPK